MTRILWLLQGRRRFWILYLSLSIITWIGGWIIYSAELAESARVGYEELQRRNLALQRQGGKAFFDLHENGPSTSVKCCIPLAPGFLLADSSSSIGGLYGEG